MRTTISLAALLRHTTVLHRRASRRQLIDDRDVEIGIGGHGQRARNRRRRHDELMGNAAVRLALLLQPQALLHAEAMLLVDDDQGELCEIDALLKQRVRADDDADLAGGDGVERAAARARRLRAATPAPPAGPAAGTSRGSCASAARPAVRSAPSARPAARCPRRAPPRPRRPPSCRNRHRLAASRTIGTAGAAGRRRPRAARAAVRRVS